MQNNQPPQWTVNDVLALFKVQKNPEGKVKLYLYLVGIILTPITLGGALWGYIMAYTKKLYHMDLPPTLAPLHPFARLAMVIFAIGIWVCLIGGILFLMGFAAAIGANTDIGAIVVILLAYMFLNGVITFVIMMAFDRWRDRMFTIRTNLNMFGSAKWATDSDLSDLPGKDGIYIGGGYTYPKQGHLITVAGTRSGKFTNLIAPNLLGAGGYQGSWFIIDPKGETAFVTAEYQKSLGRKVRFLDPWHVYTTTPDSYDPLGMLIGADDENLVDDASMIAEMIMPQNLNLKDPFFSDRARSIVTGLIIHHVLKFKAYVETLTPETPVDTKQKLSLAQIWRWVRLPQDQFIELLMEMTESDNEVVRATGEECHSIVTNSPKTYGSIMSEIHTQTDFLRSSALQMSLQISQFDMDELSDGNTTVYVIVPPDKVDSQSKWLRVVVASALRSVVRNRNKRVSFVLDEFPSLGRINDVNTFMAMGAGYNITLWPIFQSLSQLQFIYGAAWQVFMAGASVKHFFGIGDTFTADYVSAMAGNSTYTVYDRQILGDEKGQPKSRPLVTSDEIRRGSADEIFTFIEQRPISKFLKYPYYMMPEIKDRARPNPYYNETIGV